MAHLQISAAGRRVLAILASGPSTPAEVDRACGWSSGYGRVVRGELARAGLLVVSGKTRGRKVALTDSAFRISSSASETPHSATPIPHPERNAESTQVQENRPNSAFRIPHSDTLARGSTSVSTCLHASSNKDKEEPSLEAHSAFRIPHSATSTPHSAFRMSHKVTRTDVPLDRLRVAVKKKLARRRQLVLEGRAEPVTDYGALAIHLAENMTTDEVDELMADEDRLARIKADRDFIHAQNVRRREERTRQEAELAAARSNADPTIDSRRKAFINQLVVKAEAERVALEAKRAAELEHFRALDAADRATNPERR